MSFLSMRGRLLVLILLYLGGLAGMAIAQEAESESVGTAAASTPPPLLDSRVTATQDRARLVLDLGTPTDFAVHTASDPMRVIVQLRAQAGENNETQPAGDGLVTGYVVEAPAPDRVQVTLTLAGPAQVQQSYVLEAFEDQPARLVIDLVPDSAENFAARLREVETGEA